MLFEVPVNRSSSAQKPLKVVSRLASAIPGASRTTKMKANYDVASVKKPRMATPPPTHDNAAIDSWQDDSFDESVLPIATETARNATNLPTQSNPAIEAFEVEDNVPKDPEIPAHPLNEDLKSSLEFHDFRGSSKFTRLYWYDCCEDQAKNPGIVYIFGRVYAVPLRRYVSCCAIVKDVHKTCYLLIKDDSTYEEVVSEFTNITAKRYRIKNFHCEKATKKYAFGDFKVPYLADYVKVNYPAAQNIPLGIVGETFSAVFNVNQTPMERVILDLKLRGPCWLKLIDPVAPGAQLTWTKIELILTSPENLVVEENPATLNVPYFCTLSISLRTYPNPITNNNEIIAIAGMVNSTFNLDQCLKSSNKASGHFIIMTKPASGHRELKLPYDFQAMMKNYTKTRFELVESERDLLLAFMDKFIDYDPDMVVGHDLLNFDYETLVMRMKMIKVGVWSKLGRFKRTEQHL